MDGVRNRINYIQLMILKLLNLEEIHKDTLDFKQRLIEIGYLILKNSKK